MILDYDVDSLILKFVGGSVIAIVSFGLWLRRKLSRDSLEIVKDRAEENVIKHLEDERDELKRDKEKLVERIIEVEKERNDAQLTVSKLSVEVQHLSEKVEELKKITEELMTKLEKATEDLHRYAIEYAALNAKISTACGPNAACGVTIITKEQ